jgi:hypothetical protein
MADKKLEKKKPPMGAAGKSQEKDAGSARPAQKPAKKPKDKSIPIDKLNASNDE